MFIKSDSIEVFPVAKTRETQLSSRLLYEDNIANISRQLIDTDGFIISGGEINNDNTLKNDFVLNVFGYNVIIKSGTTIIPSNATMKNYIIITPSYDVTNDVVKDANGDIISVNTIMRELSTDDLDATNTNKEFKGMEITAINSITDATAPYVVLYSRADTTDSWSVHNNSKIKFNTSSVDFSGIVGIDGKV